jgi:hypothetical protein
MIAGVAGLGMTIFGAVLCCFCPPAIGLFAVSSIKMVEGFTYWIAEDCNAPLILTTGWTPHYGRIGSGILDQAV